MAVSKFVTRELSKTNCLSNGVVSLNKNIKLKTPILRSDLGDYSDLYIVVKERIIENKRH